MKRRTLPPRKTHPARALAAFAATVALAVMATVLLMLPDTTANSADALTRVLSDFEPWFAGGIFN
ncbi:hypothetical protein [Simplicispira psychrophila]|uniref:hypothetical protein n=1 Tax=Simplicispira psychrophila TaxID=80882 RepID=UPI0012EB13ED|nr:hypothetical protein [Simplicispira psychrophila]